ncbi:MULTISPECIES: GntR family transcriptional regulator [Aminobacter]|uniref:DNA-binding GntR family transcriptional regulator n=1 Tax=Aminobacter ciceronei TaxID=150723 RepID=A0ABR6CH47_9HYPH|nr:MULTISPECIES: GntR family transcriptional regulator [Aminobacter]MBA8910576.1 DNA-binding GntR family transcriptional regulator [Aminobacter ciceronei]MBA9024348.1 DNA-binding GntR family transcriptional regulator [Aminobacter ciceronei]MCX8571059.1 GntR family transcriptional regulator [Aminobacter sp. MET-1]
MKALKSALDRRSRATDYVLLAVRTKDDMASRKNEANLVYDMLTRAIIEQALAPETKLPEEAISKQLNVSRHAVRSALQMLAADELVEIKQNKGATVAKPSVEQGRDILRMRMELEDVVIRTLAGKLTAAQVEELRNSVKLEHEYLEKDPASYKGQTSSFHRTLARMTNSKLLSKYLEPLLTQSSLVFYIYGRPHWTKCNSDEHTEIIDALEIGNIDRAQSIMRMHLEAIYERAFSDDKISDIKSLHDALDKYTQVGNSALRKANA